MIYGLLALRMQVVNYMGATITSNGWVCSRTDTVVFRSFFMWNRRGRFFFQLVGRSNCVFRCLSALIGSARIAQADDEEHEEEEAGTHTVRECMCVCVSLNQRAKR